MDEPDAVDVWGTCLTTGCESYGAPAHVAELWGQLICGPCGNPVTRFEENAPAEPKEMPTWEL